MASIQTFPFILGTPSRQARERARKQGKMFDYFSVSIFETQAELLDHAVMNHDNTVRHARAARNQIRVQHRDAHRSHELACEDKAHAHSILARAGEIPCQTPDDSECKRHTLAICKRTLKIKV